ncbi:aldo/keto reductase [Niabella terrae]
MNYHLLGKTPLKISAIGFGAMSLLKAPASQHAGLIGAAIDQGINYFDTADMYDKGENEKTLGRLLQPHRKDLVLATKVGNQWREDGSGWDWNPGKAYIIQSVEGSLQRLQTDYIDVYQLHGGTIDDPIDETIEAFELLVQQGKIRYYGISSIRPNVIRAYIKRSSIQSVMMQYSLLDRRPEEEMLQLLQDHSISVLTRGVLAQGLLVDKPAKDYLGFSAKQVGDLQRYLEDRAVNGLSRIALAEQYVLQTPAVSSLVIGFRTREQLINAVSGLEQAVPTPVLNELSAALPVRNYTQHR